LLLASGESGLCLCRTGLLDWLRAERATMPGHGIPCRPAAGDWRQCAAASAGLGADQQGQVRCRCIAPSTAHVVLYGLMARTSGPRSATRRCLTRALRIGPVTSQAAPTALLQPHLHPYGNWDKPGHDRESGAENPMRRRFVSDRRQRQQSVASDHRCMIGALHSLYRRPERRAHREPVDHLDPLGAAALHVVAM
jgi:hypothetical protein